MPHEPTLGQDQFSGWPLNGVIVAPSAITDESLRLLASRPRLSNLAVESDHITPAGLMLLGKAPRLKRILYQGKKVDAVPPMAPPPYPGLEHGIPKDFRF